MTTPKHSGRLRGRGAILPGVSHRPARVRFAPPPMKATRRSESSPRGAARVARAQARFRDQPQVLVRRAPWRQVLLREVVVQRVQGRLAARRQLHRARQRLRPVRELGGWLAIGSDSAEEPVRFVSSVFDSVTNARVGLALSPIRTDLD